MEAENSTSLEKVMGNSCLPIEWAGVGFLRLVELVWAGGELGLKLEMTGPDF